MVPDWVSIFSTNQYYEAEMVRAMLESNDINSILVNKQDSAYLIGEIEVYVSTGDALKAKQLIDQHENE